MLLLQQLSTETLEELQNTNLRCYNHRQEGFYPLWELTPAPQRQRPGLGSTAPSITQPRGSTPPNPAIRGWRAGSPPLAETSPGSPPLPSSVAIFPAESFTAPRRATPRESPQKARGAAGKFGRPQPLSNRRGTQRCPGHAVAQRREGGAEWGACAWAAGLGWAL